MYVFFTIQVKSLETVMMVLAHFTNPQPNQPDDGINDHGGPARDLLMEQIFEPSAMNPTYRAICRVYYNQFRERYQMRFLDLNDERVELPFFEPLPREERENGMDRPGW